MGSAPSMPERAHNLVLVGGLFNTVNTLEAAAGPALALIVAVRTTRVLYFDRDFANLARAARVVYSVGKRNEKGTRKERHRK